MIQSENYDWEKEELAKQLEKLRAELAAEREGCAHYKRDWQIAIDELASARAKEEKAVSAYCVELSMRGTAEAERDALRAELTAARESLLIGVKEWDETRRDLEAMREKHAAAERRANHYEQAARSWEQQARLKY